MAFTDKVMPAGWLDVRFPDDTISMKAENLEDVVSVASSIRTYAIVIVVFATLITAAALF